MLVRWELDGDSSDSTPYGMDLVYQGDGEPPQFAPGRFGLATWTGGNDGVVRDSPGVSELLSTADRGFALSFWGFPDSSIMSPWNTYYLFGNQPAAMTALKMSYTGLAGDLPGTITSWLLPGGGLEESFSVPFSDFGRWTHVTLSYDRLAGEFTYYQNGNIRRIDRYSESVTDWDQALFLADFAGSGFAGGLDRVLLFGRPLSPVEARALFAHEHVEGHWTFDRDPNDSGPFAFSGSLVGDAHVQALHRWRNRALDLDGQGDFVEVLEGQGGQSEHLDRLQHGMTVSLWMRPEAGCDGYVLTKGSPVTSPLTIRYEDVPGTPMDILFVRVNTTTGQYGGMVLGDLTGGWHNVQVVYDAFAPVLKVRVLVDGEQEAAGCPSGDPMSPLATNDFPFSFGGSAQTPGEEFLGQLDDVQLFNQALPPEGLATLRSSVIADFPFADDSLDDSPFRHRLVLLGGAVVTQALVLNNGGGDDDRACIGNHWVFADSNDTFRVDFKVFFNDEHELATPIIGAYAYQPFAVLLAGGTLYACISATCRGIDYGKYINAWTDVSVRFDRFKTEIGQSNLAIILDNQIDHDEAQYSIDPKETRYGDSSICIGSFLEYGAPWMLMRNLQIRRTWE